MMPAFAKDVFHSGANAANIQNWLVGAVGVGAVISTLTIASLGRAPGNGKLMPDFANVFRYFSGAVFVFASLAGCHYFHISGRADKQRLCDAKPDHNTNTCTCKSSRYGAWPLLPPPGADACWQPGDGWLNSPAWAVTIMGGACILVVIVMTIITPQMLKLGNLNPWEGNDALPPASG